MNLDTADLALMSEVRMRTSPVLIDGCRPSCARHGAGLEDNIDLWLVLINNHSWEVFQKQTFLRSRPTCGFWQESLFLELTLDLRQLNQQIGKKWTWVNLFILINVSICSLYGTLWYTSTIVLHPEVAGQLEQCQMLYLMVWIVAHWFKRLNYVQ